MVSQDAFVLQDGSVLRYATPKDKGDQADWFRSHKNALLLNWRATSKESSIRLGLWNSRSNFFVVAADFDKVPIGFSDYDRLEEYFRDTYSDLFLVTRSYSGKVKAFCLVHLDDGVSMSTTIALDVLTKFLPPDLFEAVDKSKAALSLTFLNPRMIRDLSRLADLTACYPVVDSDSQIDESYVNKKITPSVPFRIFDGEILGGLADWCRSSKSRIGLLRILLASPGLQSERGMDLPVTKLSRECHASLMTVSRHLRSLCTSGFLQCTSAKYRVGEKAKTYSARGELTAILKSIHGQRSYSQKPDLSQLKIADGCWHETLFKVSGAFGNRLDEFESEANAIPGIEKKDRRRKIAGVVRQRRKYQKAHM